MRIALAGKGGTGKTTLSATIARSLARRGADVVAIDVDSNPNLALALGVPADTAAQLGALPGGMVSRRIDGPQLKMPVEEVFDRHGLVGPDGVRVALMGMPAHAEEGCMCAAHATVAAVLGDLGERPDTITVVDMEASPEHFSRGTAKHVDALLLVTEAYYRSLETIRRMAALASELPIPRVAVLANKVRSAGDADAIREFCGRHDLEMAGWVPFDDAVVQADVDRIPLIDGHPDSRVVHAIAALAADLAGLPSEAPASFSGAS